MAEDTAPNYHVSIWNKEDPTYLCLLCPDIRGLTLDAVLTHVQEVHQVAPVPSPTIPSLLEMRAASDAGTAPAPAPLFDPITIPRVPVPEGPSLPPQEESRHA